MKTIRFLTTVFVALAILLGLIIGGCREKTQVKKVRSKGEARSDLTPAAPGGHVYYVAKNGGNKNPGTAEQPWLTIQHAAEKMAAGDKLYIRDGIYNGSVQIKKNGGPDANIVFAAYPGERPIIDGSGVKDWNNGIIIDKSSYIKLAGLDIRNWNDNGMLISKSSHLEISNCVVHDVGGGISFLDGTHDFELNRVEAHHFELLGFDASPSEGGAPCYNGTFNSALPVQGETKTKMWMDLPSGTETSTTSSSTAARSMMSLMGLI